MSRVRLCTDSLVRVAPAAAARIPRTEEAATTLLPGEIREIDTRIVAVAAVDIVTRLGAMTTKMTEAEDAITAKTMTGGAATVVTMVAGVARIGREKAMIGKTDDGIVTVDGTKMTIRKTIIVAAAAETNGETVMTGETVNGTGVEIATEGLNMTRYPRVRMLLAATITLT